MFAGPSKQAFHLPALRSRPGSSQGFASTQAASLARDEDHAASEGRYLAQAPEELGPGSSCYGARINLLDCLQRSRPGFALGIFSPTEIDCHRAAGTLPTRDSNAGERHVRAPARESCCEGGEACEDNATAGAGGEE